MILTVIARGRFETAILKATGRRNRCGGRRIQL